jgi:hypothetical protein
MHVEYFSLHLDIRLLALYLRNSSNLTIWIWARVLATFYICVDLTLKICAFGHKITLYLKNTLTIISSLHETETVAWQALNKIIC